MGVQRIQIGIVGAVVAGVPMFFYDEASAARELGAYGITDVSEIDEPVAGGSYPFYNVTCVKR
jgi:hypothetical protein